MGAKCCRQLGLNHESPELFYSPQYKIPMSLYAIFRLFIFTYSFVIITCNFIYKVDRTPWVYLTNWTYIVQVICYLVKAIIALDRAFLYGCKRYDQSNKYGSGRDRMCWYLKLEWLLHNVAVSIPFMVMIGYWSGSWEMNKNRNFAVPMYMHLTIQLHGINAFLALLDLLLGATPTRLAHIYQPLLYFALYFSFSGVLYAVSDHGPIYPNLNWDEPGGTLLFILAYIGEAIACHLFVWIVKLVQVRLGCCGCLLPPPSAISRPYLEADATTPLIKSKGHDDDVFL